MENLFLKLIELNQGILHKICIIYASDKEDRKDLMQEMLLQLWKAYPSYDIARQVKFSTWLYRVALNTALNFRRKKSTALLIQDELALQIPDTAAGLGKDENKEVLYHCIQQLPEIDRALILLYLEGHTYEEISQVTGFTENNVGVKLSRIKTKLQKCFK